MPLREVHCAARSRVRPITPAFEEAYAACGMVPGRRPSTLPTLTIEPPPVAARPKAWAIR